VFTPRPVLVVEDDRDSRAMLTMALEYAGLPVVTATNGVEAFNVARAHHPSLILLDLMMPTMTGEEFRRAQLANADIRNIPVVVVSARHDAPQIARRMRASGCLVKPIDFDKLAAVVARYCRHA
jgi:two-component system cell cycle response regulator DivK